MTVAFTIDRGTTQEVLRHLLECDALFSPPLSRRINLSNYAQKMVTHATRFEAWSGEDMVGLVALYCNAVNGLCAFVSNVSVMSGFTGQGIAKKLMTSSIDHARQLNFHQIVLEVSPSSQSAIRLYEEMGFRSTNPQSASKLTMVLLLSNGS